ncbi:hypothetical protein QO009_003871 [Brevibacillus aydinogluensis]|nr:hypothetical protein [Brevibacillus aydinogluensis]
MIGADESRLMMESPLYIDSGFVFAYMPEDRRGE